jgi:hypothetical protein
MRKTIPAPIISAISDLVSHCETHATLDSLFMHAGASGSPPSESKLAKAQTWLRHVNKDEDVEPLEVLGLIIEGYMEEESEIKFDDWHVEKYQKIERLKNALKKANLTYIQGGKIIGAYSTPAISLEQHIRKRNIDSVNLEFDRAISNIEASPREAISAACNILESVFKVYIEEEGLVMPSKKDLKPTWAVVRESLNFDHSKVEDRDLKEILGGIAGIVGGVGALRTHASSAHGSGKKIYNIEPRHARLAVHSAHTIALFVLESWEKKNKI